VLLDCIVVVFLLCFESADDGDSASLRFVACLTASSNDLAQKVEFHAEAKKFQRAMDRLQRKDRHNQVREEEEWSFFFACFCFGFIFSASSFLPVV
jgi:hypothetical protein